MLDAQLAKLALGREPTLLNDRYGRIPQRDCDRAPDLGIVEMGLRAQGRDRRENLYGQGRDYQAGQECSRVWSRGGDTTRQPVIRSSLQLVADLYNCSQRGNELPA